MPLSDPPAEIEHAEWCSVAFGHSDCDCGGNGGRCPICGAQGPCGFITDGENVLPAICSMADLLRGDVR